MNPAPEKIRPRTQGSTGYFPRTLRIPFVRRCTLKRSKVEQDAMILDLSLNGAYVMTDFLPSEGESLEVNFRVPGNDRILRIRSVVAWLNRHQAHPVHSLPPGFGLSFLDPSLDDRKLITKAIESYLRAHPMYRQYL